MTSFPVPRKPFTSPQTLALCWAGKEPAELLTRGERDLLLFELWFKGWTDLQISVHMKLTLFTTCRIRERLGLSVRRACEEAA